MQKVFRSVAWICVSSIAVIVWALPTVEESGEYEVWSCALNELDVRFEGSAQIVLMNEAGGFDYTAQKLKAYFETAHPQWSQLLQPDTVDDFVQRNSQKLALEPKFEFEVPYVFVAPKEKERLLKSSKKFPLGRFSEKYPKALGVTSLSRVGFSNDKQQALLYVSVVDGSGLCCGAYYVLLTKKESTWVVEDRFWVWQS